MIDKEKLNKFLTNRHAEANRDSHCLITGAEYFYRLGQVHTTAEIISKLNSGEFDIKDEGEEIEAYIQTLEEEASKG